MKNRCERDHLPLTRERPLTCFHAHEVQQRVMSITLDATTETIGMAYGTAPHIVRSHGATWSSVIICTSIPALYQENQ